MRVSQASINDPSMTCGMTMFRLPEKVMWPYWTTGTDGTMPADYDGKDGNVPHEI